MAYGCRETSKLRCFKSHRGVIPYIECEMKIQPMFFFFFFFQKQKGQQTQIWKFDEPVKHFFLNVCKSMLGLCINMHVYRSGSARSYVDINCLAFINIIIIIIISKFIASRMSSTFYYGQVYAFLPTYISLEFEYFECNAPTR